MIIILEKKAGLYMQSLVKVFKDQNKELHYFNWPRLASTYFTILYLLIDLKLILY